MSCLSRSYLVSALIKVGIPRWGTGPQRFREGNFMLVFTPGLILIASTRNRCRVVRDETYVELEIAEKNKRERMSFECEEIEIRDVLEKNNRIERTVNSKKSPKLCALCGVCFSIFPLNFSSSRTSP